MGDEKQKQPEEKKSSSFADQVQQEDAEKKKAEEIVKKRLQIVMVIRDPLTARIVELRNIQNVPQQNDACMLLREGLEEYAMLRSKAVIMSALAELLTKKKKGKLAI